MKMAKRKRIIIIILTITVALAAVFFYTNQKPGQQNILANNEQADSIPIFPAPEKTQYQMKLYLDIQNRVLYSNTLLTTTNTSAKVLNDLWFTVYPNCFKNASDTPAPPEAYYAGFNQGWLQFDSVKVNGTKAQLNEKGVCVEIKTPSPIKPGEDIVVEMQWHEKIPRLKYRYGNVGSVYMLGNFYPALNILSQDGWHNSYNSVFGDPFCFHSANYLVSLNIPENYQMVSTGTITSTQLVDDGRATYIVQAQNARDFCLSLMYDYTEIKQQVNKTTVKCYLPGEYSEHAQKILNKAVSILNYYSCQYGSYPYSEFKVVFVPMQGFHGMEYSGLIYLREDYLYDEQQNSDYILAHEIAHQWWYGLVGNDQLREPWLDEGLANWSAYKYLAEVEGIQPPVETELKTGVDLGKELRDMYSSQDYYRTAYSGGEAFWFGLEKELGKETVIKVLRRYLAVYRNRIATTQDLMKVIKMEANKDMDDYIRQWFPSGTK